MGWGGTRPNSGRKSKAWHQANATAPKASSSRRRIESSTETSASPKAPAEPKKPETISAAAMMRAVERIREHSRAQADRRTELNPFVAAKPPPGVVPADKRMAMDSALAGWANTAWLDGAVFNSISAEGVQFLGYPFLSQLAQRPEYRVISETIADDCTRKWIDFDVTGDEKEIQDRLTKDPRGERERMNDPDARKQRVARSGKADKVKALKDDQERLEVRDRFYQTIVNDGFFGRSHLEIDLGVGREELKTPLGDGRSELSRAKVQKGSFRDLKVIEPVWTYPTTYNATNPLEPWWYDPEVWYVMGVEVHKSRLMPFVGSPVPDMLKPAYSFGGLSLSQMAMPYVDIWLQTRQHVADLIRNFSIVALSSDLAALLQPGGANDLIARCLLFNATRDNQGLMLLNKATEELKIITASLAGLDHLQAQSQEHICSAVRIPLVKFTGISPSGLNATSEFEVKVYDDTISARQHRLMRSKLTRVINFEQLSMWGEVDPEITFRFEPLRELDEKERGEKEAKDAERNQKYVDMGALAPGEIRKAIIDDPTLPYTDLDPDEVPDLAQEEEDGLQPEGGHSDPAANGGAEDTRLPFAQDGRLQNRKFSRNIPVRRNRRGAGEMAKDAAFSESEHPRGQPGNAGQFGSGGGGKESSGKEPAKKDNPDKTRAWENPAVLARAIKRSKFTKAGDALRKEHSSLEELNGEIGSALSDIHDITPEDRADLKNDEEFEGEQNFLDAIDNTIIYADSVRSKLRDLGNKAAEFIGEAPHETDAENDVDELSVTASERIEKIASDASDLAEEIDSEVESLQELIDDEDADEDDIQNGVDVLREKVQGLHDHVKEALAEIDLVMKGKHEDVETEEKERVTDAERWGKLTRVERQAEIKARQDAREDDDRRSVQEARGKVDEALESGWRPSFNDHGGWERPEALKSVASPRQLEAVYQRLDEKGIELPKRIRDGWLKK